MARHLKSRNMQLADRDAIDPRIPVYLVTGARGGSKTAFLERVIARDFARASCAFVLVNRCTWQATTSGAASIPGAPGMARRRTGEVCVAGGADPVDAMYQLHLRRLGLLKPQIAYGAVVMEVAHVVDTGSFVAVVQNETRLDATYRVAGVIHVVDLHDHPFRGDAARLCGIGEADTIVLQHDCGSRTGAVRDAIDAISSLNPFAAVVTADEFVLGATGPWQRSPGSFTVADAGRLCREDGLVRLAGRSGASFAVANNLYNDPRTNEPADATLRALRICVSGEIDLMAFMQAVSELCTVHGAGVLRLSAVLNVRHAEYPVAVDVVGGTLLYPAYHSAVRRDDSDICVLARGLDVPGALDTFDRCSWNLSATRERLGAAM